MVMNREDNCPDAHEEDVECMVWLYDGTVLATGGCDSTVKLWDVEKEYVWRSSCDVQLLLLGDDQRAQEQRVRPRLLPRAGLPGDGGSRQQH